jgi:hypothetical protein
LTTLPIAGARRPWVRGRSRACGHLHGRIAPVDNLCLHAAWPVGELRIRMGTLRNFRTGNSRYLH